MTRMDGGDGALEVWNANSIIGTAYKDKLQGGHLPANEDTEVPIGCMGVLRVRRGPWTFCSHNARGGALAA